MSNFTVIENPNGVPIKAWNKGVQFEESGLKQLLNVASMPFVTPYVASMPDMHWGNGATVGSVIPSQGALMPAAVGVDIGCGMIAVRTNADKDTYKNCLPEIRSRIENAVPHGRTSNGGPGDRGSWGNIPEFIHDVFCVSFEPEYNNLCEKHPGARSRNAEKQLGTLGTGNHFIELSLDELDRLWVVLHSGSRGFGNRIGSYFTQVAKQKCEAWMVKLPDPELAYLPIGTQEYGDYIGALHLAQRFAWDNRILMVQAVISRLSLRSEEEPIHCHHNYMAQEKHFGQDVILTRKGAVDADLDKLVIIPGSMGARTYIARGLGNRDSFHSCSHGAGRSMSRGQARKTISLEQHAADTCGVECHKGIEVIDESPAAYKDIEAVMAAQSDLVEPVHQLKQILCVKGLDYNGGRR